MQQCVSVGSSRLCCSAFKLHTYFSYFCCLNTAGILTLLSRGRVTRAILMETGVTKTRGVKFRWEKCDVCDPGCGIPSVGKSVTCGRATDWLPIKIDRP